MAVQLIFCYAREDEHLLNKLKTQLRPLQRQGLIDVWYDRNISAGTEWEKEISEHLSSAQIILLLVSPDFIDSDYCYGIEMKRALERHANNEARVIPVILRPALWRETPLSKLNALPTDGQPVIDRAWHTLDEALLNVAEGVSVVVKQLLAPKLQPVRPEELSLLRTLTDHVGRVLGVAFSPDGRTLVSGSADQTIKLWNMQSGELLHTLTGHTKGAASVAFSPDGQTLASASWDQTIKLWNILTSQLLHTLSNYTSYVWGVTFSPNGQYLASGSGDQTICIWGRK